MMENLQAVLQELLLEAMISFTGARMSLSQGTAVSEYLVILILKSCEKVSHQTKNRKQRSVKK